MDYQLVEDLFRKIEDVYRTSRDPNLQKEIEEGLTKLLESALKSATANRGGQSLPLLKTKEEPISPRNAAKTIEETIPWRNQLDDQFFDEATLLSPQNETNDGDGNHSTEEENGDLTSGTLPPPGESPLSPPPDLDESIMFRVKRTKPVIIDSDDEDGGDEHHLPVPENGGNDGDNEQTKVSGDNLCGSDDLQEENIFDESTEIYGSDIELSICNSSPLAAAKVSQTDIIQEVERSLKNLTIKQSSPSVEISSDSESDDEEWQEIIKSAKKAVKKERKLRLKSATSVSSSSSVIPTTKAETSSSATKLQFSNTTSPPPSFKTPSKTKILGSTIVFKTSSTTAVDKSPYFQSSKSQNKHLERLGITFDIFEPLPKEFFKGTHNKHVNNLFKSLDSALFGGILTVSGVTAYWSNKLTRSAGMFNGKRNADKSIKEASIALSYRLFPTRRGKDFIETLLHEMIHAHLFVTGERDATAHGTNFKEMMKKVSQSSGFSISITHDYHDEVLAQQVYVWRCDGICRSMKELNYGYVKRSVNRPPGPQEKGWLRHSHFCDGDYLVVSRGSQEYDFAMTALR